MNVQPYEIPFIKIEKTCLRMHAYGAQALARIDMKNLRRTKKTNKKKTKKKLHIRIYLIVIHILIEPTYHPLAIHITFTFNCSGNREHSEQEDV